MPSEKRYVDGRLLGKKERAACARHKSGPYGICPLCPLRGKGLARHRRYSKELVLSAQVRDGGFAPPKGRPDTPSVNPHHSSSTELSFEARLLLDVILLSSNQEIKKSKKLEEKMERFLGGCGY